MSRLLLVVVAVTWLISGCGAGASDGPERPDYTPVPDHKLISQVAALPGVERADLSYNDAWPEHSYIATITLSSDADAQLVLDTIYAKLWQGRPGAGILVEAQQNGSVVRLDAFGGKPTTRIALEKRYGPQPGSGTPPTD
ncbi:RNA-binding protein [Aeromicrobium wangtongii]|uniref:Lipoprotein n=1 Tax=Aeromicrobium wangtongii TaxID=2969247 RepID=A0ABY5MCH9_9ACTN|nr:hypothetical protein [Aeromicrobium wangtongii]MCD9199893.1 hypothetical protein [Aeromicrobium wangtongii]UUP13511.1 hypothetical protein NQV15_16925 [Aeromicrobium wangtongii]